MGRTLAILLFTWAAAISSPASADERAAGSVAACLANQADLDKAKAEASELDIDLGKAPSRNKAVGEMTDRLQKKSVAQLDTILQNTNEWLDHVDPDKKIIKGGMIDFRDYVANLEAWKRSGGLLDEPKPPASFSVDIAALSQRRTAVGNRIVQLQKDREAMGCDGTIAATPSPSSHCDAVTAQEAMADEEAAMLKLYPTGINTEKEYDWTQANVDPKMQEAHQAVDKHDYDGACKIYHDLIKVIAQHRR